MVSALKFLACELREARVFTRKTRFERNVANFFHFRPIYKTLRSLQFMCGRLRCHGSAMRAIGPPVLTQHRTRYS